MGKLVRQKENDVYVVHYLSYFVYADPVAGVRRFFLFDKKKNDVIHLVSYFWSDCKLVYTDPVAVVVPVAAVVDIGGGVHGGRVGGSNVAVLVYIGGDRGRCVDGDSPAVVFSFPWQTVVSQAIQSPQRTRTADEGCNETFTVALCKELSFVSDCYVSTLLSCADGLCKSRSVYLCKPRLYTPHQSDRQQHWKPNLHEISTISISHVLGAAKWNR